MNRRYINLERSLCKELTALEEKYRNGQEMSEGDLRRIDLLAHSMKCLMGYMKMRQEFDNEYDEEPMNGNSYMNSYGVNQYNNQNSYNMNNSYDNYNRDNRFSNSNMDRHYPPMPYLDRRW